MRFPLRRGVATLSRKPSRFFPATRASSRDGSKAASPTAPPTHSPTSICTFASPKLRGTRFGSTAASLIERIAPILAAADVMGVFGIGCLLEGPVKLDVFFERESTLASKQRIAVKRLWGAEEIFARLRIGDDLGDAAIARALEYTVLGFLQGATWPVRLLARGQHRTFLYGEILLIENRYRSADAAGEGSARVSSKHVHALEAACAGAAGRTCAVDRARDGGGERRDRDAMRAVHLEILACFAGSDAPHSSITVSNSPASGGGDGGILPSRVAVLMRR